MSELIQTAVLLLTIFNGLAVGKMDNNWLNWSSWGHCSVTCGQGTVTRYCNVSHPKFVDMNEVGECVSHWTETKSCTLNACPVPIITCNGKSGKNACNVNYLNDGILVRGKKIERSSGGECYAPNQCRDCNDGFYADGPYCKICPKIDHCNHRKCNNIDDNHCAWCEGALKPKKYWNAYIWYPPNNMKKCHKACSWRPDSTRCYPGTCENELASKCKCWNGFGGQQCDEIKIDVKVNYALIQLKYKTEILTTPDDPNEDATRHSVKWTNNVGWEKAEIDIVSSFKVDESPPEKPGYITYFQYGVTRASVELQFENGEGHPRDVHTFSCGWTDIHKPVHCKKEGIDALDISGWDFKHRNRLYFKWRVENGGYLNYTDREANGKEIKVHLNGRTLLRDYIFEWDLINPYFPCVVRSGVCNDSPIKTNDITEQRNAFISWPGWTDDDSGVDYYTLEVFEMFSDGSYLVQDLYMVVKDYNIPASTPKATFVLKSPGMYTVTIAVFDKTTNYKAARCLVFFDDQSKVEKRQEKRTLLEQATKVTNFKWVSIDDQALKITWKDRFINDRHKRNNWLSGVKHVHGVDPEYDDYYGRRTIHEIQNIHGIVRFEIQYKVYGPNLNFEQRFTATSNLKSQEGVINVPWTNGNRLDITVRAIDVMNKHADDTITVYKDSTPPVINNLWLSDGDRVNISVHSVEDFTKMTIEWDAYDYDSGMDEIEWRLFDNFTSKIILHGKAEMHAQGLAQNLTQCKTKYMEEPRGPSCYCTMFHGCYHKHFHVTPMISDVGKNAGILTGKDKGIHDSDYYIEVTVTNKALLKTTVSKRITIDVTPPYEGFVHDGIRGDPEVDYQQDLHLNVHWEGFFDRESGVEYYMYIFSDHCFTNEEFISSSKTKKTYLTFASSVAESEGYYHVSVVAVNRANDKSNVVCSDGVQITTRVPYVRDVLIDGAKTKERMVKYQGQIWKLDRNLKRHLVLNSSVSCKFTSDTQIAMLPTSTQIYVADNFLCHSPNKSILAVIPRTLQFKISWKPDVPENLIYDYEVGLSTTESAIAPDLSPFRSSKHHTHFRLNHPDVADGKQFYAVIKTISKSGAEGTQSLGPFIVDTTKPRITDTHIDVKLENGFLVANWSEYAFSDQEDPYPMALEYAIGHQPEMSDIKPFGELHFYGSCERTVPATCTAININDLKWSLHPNHAYYFTIKATNLAGLSAIWASSKYIHDIQPPSEVLVFDVKNDYPTFQKELDNIDIDFTTGNNSLSITWSRFVHPYQDVTYEACVGSAPKSCDTVAMVAVHSSTSFHTFSSLDLMPFKIYYSTIKASTSYGSISVSSDGVTVLDVLEPLEGILVKDGTNCEESHELRSSHHQQDSRPSCKNDIDFQTSTTTLSSYWTVPDAYKPFIREAFVKVEERIIGGVWKTFQGYTYVGSHQFAILNDMTLKPGKTYRIVLQFCSEDICFLPVFSDGVTILVNSPVPGDVEINLLNATNKLFVTFEKMHDPDIPDISEAINVCSFYEWALGDDDGLHTKWNVMEKYTNLDIKHILFNIIFNKTMDHSKCQKVFLRGYNRAGLWTTISADIKQCVDKKGHSVLTPNKIIDAIGRQKYSLDGTKRDGFGLDIHLDENERWKENDRDYTPYKNVLSATWTSLRHKNFTWAIIDAANLDINNNYKNNEMLMLSDPCSHSDAIKCGKTEKAYINAIFNSTEELVHGNRYIICVNAPRKEVKYEQWTEVLDEVKACSDGVTVDLTPPKPGNVWIGLDSHQKYQSSCSDIFVSWESFTDVEEFDMKVHSGIKEYMIGIGSTWGATDIAEYKSVGLVNHFTAHGLRLQNGHEYFATVKGIDFVGRSSQSISHPVKIDMSPPEISEEPISIKGRHLSNMNEIDACWRDVFMDVESGIDYYLWAVGSRPGHDDIIPFTKTTLDCGISAEDRSLDIHDGHAYFITVKAINRANLVSTASSWAYIYEMSPPYPGHVFDGSPDQILSYDIDYQLDRNKLSNYWEGFYDPHSTIKTYYISIGTCAKCNDILSNQDIGTPKNFTLYDMNLGRGIRYYTTVTACNTADLCTSVSSDGVVIDDSPPTQGIVLDGIDVYDIEYQSMRNYLSARWHSFQDPESGLDKFTWRAGTQPGLDDIIESTLLTSTDILVEPNLKNSLPLGKRIYVTIKAYNYAGLSTEATSNGFIVDDTPPTIHMPPYLSTDLGSIKNNSVVFRNSIRVKWKVEDPESYIQRQYLSISSHKGGHFNSSQDEVNGIMREYTFSRVDLQDGCNYTVNLIACNGARICSESNSLGILVDSSPPTPGMFAIKTDCAANLRRHIEGWMTWSRYKLWLSWLGFTDIHSGIDKYYVSVGSQYMIDDLNKVAGSPQECTHSESGADEQDEGFVQTFEIDVTNLTMYKHVFVSVLAVNKVGLSSMMVHSQFRLIPGGSLELIRRCSAVTCKGHCVCAAQGQRCPLIGKRCQDISKGNNDTLIGVYDITDVRPTSPFTDVDYTPSNVALAAKWHIIIAQGQRPLWYEWTAGLTKSATIQGIFTGTESVWNHAGQSNQAVFNIKQGRYLKEPDVVYSMVIRAWYSDDTYADFRTDGVHVQSSKLSRRKIKGSSVVEEIPGHRKKDVDFFRPYSLFTIRWSNVFRDDVNIIERFMVYLSTYPGGHDIHTIELDLPATVTAFNISRVPLTPGIVFYSNVVGYSWSGIHATETSDGFMIDLQQPVVGTVHDGIGIHDINYQNNTESISASWNGFSDRGSGILHYMWCVQSNSLPDGTCDIRDWENVGIQRSVSRTLNDSTLYQAIKVKSLVYAVDLTGQKSEMSKSDGLTIDTTHPEPTYMEHLKHNIASNPSFEDSNTDALKNWDEVHNASFCSSSFNVQPIHWNISVGSCVRIFMSKRDVAMDGRAFLYVKGQVSQTLKGLLVNRSYRVTFVTAHLPYNGEVLANKEGFVDVGGQRFIFMIYTKQYKQTTSLDSVDWQHHTFYFRPYKPDVSIKLGSMAGNTGLLFDNVKIQEIELHNYDDDSANKQVHVHVVSLHQWSSIHASWSFMDPESPIVDYMWAVGYTEGSTEVQGFKSVGLRNFAYNYNVTLAHTSVIHITVVATNAAGLRSKVHAGEVLVDLTPPEILFINDGLGFDLSSQLSKIITANWDVRDSESGIDYCEWAVGYQPYGNEIQAFVKLSNDVKSIAKVFPSQKLFMQMVHVTLRCRNKAGLHSSLSTDGVKISNMPPDTTYAEVQILPRSLTEYNARSHYQSDASSAKLKWTGFKDVTGIDSFMLSLQRFDKTTAFTKLITAEDQEISYCTLQGLELNDGKHTASVKAINKMYLRSQPVKAVVLISSNFPHLRDSHLDFTKDNRTITTSWADNFQTTEPIYYEVSAGTTLGGVDIIQWQETKNTFLEFTIPPKIKSVKLITCYITVQGVAANGMKTILQGVVKL